MRRRTLPRLLPAAAALLLLAACSTEPRVIAVRSYQAPPPAPARQHPERPGYYRVVAGDTLYSIAFRHQMDYRELARINGIGPPYTIYPGQELRLRGSAPPPAPFVPAPATPRAGGSAPPPAGVASSAAVATVASTPGVPASAGSGTAAWPAPPPGMPGEAASAPPAPAGRTRTVDGIRWRWPAEGRLLQGFQADQPGRQGVDIGGHMGQPVYAAASGVVVYSGSGLTGYGELVIIKHNDEFLSAYGHNSVRLVKEGQHVVAGQQIAEMGNTGAPRVELHFEIRRNGQPLDPLDFLPRR